MAVSYLHVRPHWVIPLSSTIDNYTRLSLQLHASDHQLHHPVYVGFTAGAGARQLEGPDDLFLGRDRRQPVHRRCGPHRQAGGGQWRCLFHHYGSHRLHSYGNFNRLPRI